MNKYLIPFIIPTIALFATGFAWVLFQILFVTFFGMLILGLVFSAGFDRL
jgi:hypothetical protein